VCGAWRGPSAPRRPTPARGGAAGRCAAGPGICGGPAGARAVSEAAAAADVAAPMPEGTQTPSAAPHLESLSLGPRARHADCSASAAPGSSAARRACDKCASASASAPASLSAHALSLLPLSPGPPSQPAGLAGLPAASVCSAGGSLARLVRRLPPRSAGRVPRPGASGGAAAAPAAAAAAAARRRRWCAGLLLLLRLRCRSAPAPPSPAAVAACAGPRGAAAPAAPASARRSCSRASSAWRGSGVGGGKGQVPAPCSGRGQPSRWAAGRFRGVLRTWSAGSHAPLLATAGGRATRPRRPPGRQGPPPLLARAPTPSGQRARSVARRVPRATAAGRPPHGPAGRGKGCVTRRRLGLRAAFSE
jgi:hypothetical protein